MNLVSFRPTIKLLADRWREAGVLLPAFPLLAQGRPLAIQEIARASQATLERVSQALDAGRCERDAEGRLIDLYGMTLTPTVHRLEIGSQVLFSCCALWAHVIPKLVDARVRVESIDPILGEVIHLSISPDGVESADPAETAATLAVTTQEAIAADVCEAFCCQVRHFVSQESAEEFAEQLPSRHVVELSELQEAADLLHEAIWSSARNPQQGRRTHTF